MTNQSTTAGSNASSAPKMQEQTQGSDADANKQALLKEIHVKWNKFSEQDASNLKSNDDLVTQLVTKYGLTKDIAQRDADTLRAGRNI